uniref:Uncharacterized protein n=1 Tax=Mus spicilegus TaxID=10103 RepID=A0A8C6H8Z0_MUSSI
MDKRKLPGDMALWLHQVLPRSGTIRAEPVQKADTGPLTLYPLISKILVFAATLTRKPVCIPTTQATSVTQKLNSFSTAITTMNSSDSCWCVHTTSILIIPASQGHTRLPKEKPTLTPYASGFY